MSHHDSFDLKPDAGSSTARHSLLRLPAVGDNAAMQTEPHKAVPPKRKRRRFQFRLRTLMIGVTLFCLVAGWLLNQASVVWERKSLLESAPV
jgi:hypothetical protein